MSKVIEPLTLQERTNLQRHLKCKLQHLERPLPPWATARMLEECGATWSDLNAIAQTGSGLAPILSEELLGKIEIWLRRWIAGGITESGEPVEDERSPHQGLQRAFENDLPESVPNRTPEQVRKMLATAAAAPAPTRAAPIMKPKVQVALPVKPAAPVAAVDEIVSPSTGMKWKCTFCRETFSGPTNRAPKEGCPCCGSKEVVDVNITGVGRLSAARRLTNLIPEPVLPMKTTMNDQVNANGSAHDEISDRQQKLLVRYHALGLQGRSRAKGDFRAEAGLSLNFFRRFTDGSGSLTGEALDAIELAIANREKPTVAPAAPTPEPAPVAAPATAVPDREEPRPLNSGRLAPQDLASGAQELEHTRDAYQRARQRFAEVTQQFAEQNKAVA